MTCRRLMKLLGFTLLSLVAATICQAQTFSVLYNFGTLAHDPNQPFYSGIIAQGRDGNLYSGANGGLLGPGDLFQLTPVGTLTTLYDFANSGDGASPYGGLTLGTDGNFYGTSYSGGFGGAPYGTIFRMTPQGGFTVLYTFTDTSDGALPLAPPIQGTDGNFYGTTCETCNGTIASGYGTVYKLTPSGNFTLLHQFDVTDGYAPTGPLVQGTDGNFYGTTSGGGANGQGEVFKITPTGNLTVLYSFDSTHGRIPEAPLMQGTDGNFYGTALSGGSHNCGVVFKITPAGKLSVLHNMNGSSDGCSPFAGLVQATDGNFYGANSQSGASSSGCPSGCGTLFRMTSQATFSVVYNFDSVTGKVPYSTLFQHTNGLLYGMTQQGGTGSVSPCSPGVCGVIYSLNIGAAPFVSSLSATAKVGKTIEILGQGFTGTTGVSFGNVGATFNVASDTYLTAIVPGGALTGAINVTTPGGTLTSNKTFRVMPQLKTFTPPSGAVGTAVTITGVSLAQTTKVTFGGVAATNFAVNSDTQVTATVPTGAKTGKIVITTAGGTATSATSFTVTP